MTSMKKRLFSGPSILPALAISFFLFICWVIVQADRGQSSDWVKDLRAFPYGDKVGHFALYGLLVLLVNLALNNKRIQVFSRAVLLGSLLVGTFAILEEFTQLGFATRNFEWYDMACDLIGISLGSYLALKLGRILIGPKPVFKS